MNRYVPKIQDVAHVAGVSTATVSRALNKPDSVSEETRATVIRAVEKTGYRFNQTARNLRSRKTGAIVVLVPHLSNPFFSQILSGIENVTSRAGYSVLIADSKHPDFGHDRILEYMRYNRADGVIVLDGSLPLEVYHNGHSFDSAAPFVFACEWTDDVPVPTIRIDNRAGARMAVEHLNSLGHRKIGHVLGPPDNVLTRERLAGTRDTLNELNLQPRNDWFIDGDFSIESGCKAARSWIQLAEKPTGVFCASDQMALGFISELSNHGYRVPRDVSVVGFDDIEIAGRFIPSLTTIRQPRNDIGATTANVLLEQIKGSQRNGDAICKILPVEIIIRDSTGPARTN
ncbi:MAG: LacI family DNA-binding transcriptional regulator [Rhizobiaceae bacterium]